MPTDAQIDANRANAEHSTGPRTEEGKARSSQNNFRWGFAGSFRVLATESQGEFDSLFGALRTEHQPATPTEEILIEKMAQHLWLSRRAQYLQDFTLTDNELTPDEQERRLALFLRYQTANDRGFSKCLNDLLKLRAEKRKAEIGFERQKRQQALVEVRQAAEQRKQDLHGAEVILAMAKADHQAILNMNLGRERPDLKPLAHAAADRIMADSFLKAA